jgi:hypothetical protein
MSIDGFLSKAFRAAVLTGTASVVGVVAGVTVAPVVLPVAAVALAGSFVTAGVSGVAFGVRAVVDYATHS